MWGCGPTASGRPGICSPSSHFTKLLDEERTGDQADGGALGTTAPGSLPAPLCNSGEGKRDRRFYGVKHSSGKRTGQDLVWL